MILRELFRLERAQEVDNLLLLLGLQPLEVLDDLIGLAAVAFVLFDRFYQVIRPSVVQEEDALSYSPEGSGSEFVGAGGALGDVVGQAFTHVVD